jgi:hypothetical protein
VRSRRGSLRYVFVSSPLQRRSDVVYNVQKHHSDLFPALPSASSSSLAAAALYLSNREFEHYTSLGHQSSAWVSPKLAGFRLGGVEENRYERKFELGAGDEGEAAVVVKVAPSTSATGRLDVSVGASNAAEDPSLFPSLTFSAFSQSTNNPSSTTLTASLPSHRLSVDVISSPSPPLPLIAEQQPEVLTLFNTSEGFSGKVEVKTPAWMKKVGTAAGEIGGKAKGGVTAPMRSSFFLSVFLFFHADALDASSFESRPGVRQGRRRCC